MFRFHLLLLYFDHTKQTQAFVVHWYWLWSALHALYSSMFSLQRFQTWTQRKSLSIVAIFLLDKNRDSNDSKISELCLHTTQKQFLYFSFRVSVINYQQFSFVSLLRLLLKNWSISKALPWSLCFVFSLKCFNSWTSSLMRL